MKKFSEIFKNKVAELCEVRSLDDIIIHFCGEEAKTEDEALFIQQTNAKYFGDSEAEQLLGNFAEIKIGVASDPNKTNFIRIDLDRTLDEFYENGWEPVLEDIRNQINYAGSIEGHAAYILDNLSNYDVIKDKLIVRPLNYQNNKKTLEGNVYSRFGDIALVLYAVVHDDEANSVLNTIKIPVSVALGWNVPVDKAMANALLNTMSWSPARIYTSILGMENIPEKETDLMAADFEMKHLADNIIPLVTTARKTNGAIAMFYPGVKERIAEMFDGSFYVAFTSIHEAMLHRLGAMDPEVIKRHLVATNRTFGSEDTLSNEVYYYCRETGAFTLCETN